MHERKDQQGKGDYRREQQKQQLAAPLRSADRPGEASLRSRLSNPLKLYEYIVHRLPACIGVFGETGAHHMIESGRR